MMPPSKWVFDRPRVDADRNARETLGAMVQSGDYSVETYRERSEQIRRQLHPVTTEAERKAARRYNQQRKRHPPTLYPCEGASCDGRHVFGIPGMTCYWCRQKEPGHHDGTPAKRRRKR